MKKERKSKVKRYNGKLNVIGSKVRRLREDKNMSLAQLSDKLQLMGIDIPKSSIQHLEEGNRIVKEYEFYGLCKILGVTMEDMLNDFITEIEQ